MIQIYIMLKKILFTISISLISFVTSSQTTQQFRRDFKTNTGIYGYVNISTRPTTVGAAYIWIQQDAVVVQGIRSQGQNFSGSVLSNQGVSFPFNCSNCFFTADGEASMTLNGTAYYGNFNRGGTINSGSIGKTNQSINFSQSTKDLHNAKRQELGYSLWEQTGSVQSLNIYNVKGGDFGKITRAVDTYLKDIQKAKKYENLISQANNAATNQEKIALLNQAKGYANDTQRSQIVQEIGSLKNNIANEQQQQQTNSYTETQNNPTPTSMPTFNRTSSTSQNTMMYDENGLATTAKIEAIKRESQARYQVQTERIQAVTTAVVGVINYFEQQRVERLRREKIQREKAAIEQRKKNLFNEQAEKYRTEYKNIVDQRYRFVNQPKLKSTLKKNGEDFKPIYIYFAYVPKNYKEYYENVAYPSTLDFSINLDTEVQFSPVFAFFPYSNGQYPFIEDIKNSIIAEYFKDKQDGYELFFFPWETSVDNVISSIDKNLHDAVNNYQFATASPSTNSEIIFLTTKASESNDYWNTDGLKKQPKEKTDYWKN